MNYTEAKNATFNLMCELYDKYGSEKGFTVDELKSERSSTGITRGVLTAVLSQLKNKGKIVKIESFYGTEYRVSDQTFIEWKFKSEQQGQSVAQDTKWQPLPIENYEEIADKADELGEVLSAENGFRDEHPLEAEYSIETMKGLSASLRNNEGKTLWVRIRNAIDNLEWLSKIFDTVSRIGKFIAPLWDALTPLLDKLKDLVGP